MKVKHSWSPFGVLPILQHRFRSAPPNQPLLNVPPEIERPTWQTADPILPAREVELLGYLKSADRSRAMSGFEGKSLSRADVEWLLANHDDGRGPVDNVERRSGLAIAGAKLDNTDLSGLPFCACDLRGVSLKGACLRLTDFSRADMRRSLLLDAKLEGALLVATKLQRAVLENAHMEGARMPLARLQGAILEGAQLEDVDLRNASLGGADLRRARFDYRSSLEGALLFTAETDGPTLGTKLADVRWNGVNVTGVDDWARCRRLGDDPFTGPLQWPITMAMWACKVVWPWMIRRPSGPQSEELKLSEPWGGVVYVAVEDIHGRKPRVLKPSNNAAPDVDEAVRANRQVGAMLREQGLVEDAVRFEYRGTQLGRRLTPSTPTWLPGGKYFVTLLHPIAILLSFFVDLVSGYGHKPQRIVVTYALVVVAFADLYQRYAHANHGFPEHGWNALWFSVIAFHGRGVISGVIEPNSSLLYVVAVEALLGFLIEAILVATLIRRLFRN